MTAYNAKFKKFAGPFIAAGIMIMSAPAMAPGAVIPDWENKKTSFKTPGVQTFYEIMNGAHSVKRGMDKIYRLDDSHVAAWIADRYADEPANSALKQSLHDAVFLSFLGGELAELQGSYRSEEVKGAVAELMKGKTLEEISGKRGAFHYARELILKRYCTGWIAKIVKDAKGAVDPQLVAEAEALYFPQMDENVQAAERAYANTKRDSARPSSLPSAGPNEIGFIPGRTANDEQFVPMRFSDAGDLIGRKKNLYHQYMTYTGTSTKASFKPTAELERIMPTVAADYEKAVKLFGAFLTEVDKKGLLTLPKDIAFKVGPHNSPTLPFPLIQGGKDVSRNTIGTTYVVSGATLFHKTLNGKTGVLVVEKTDVAAKS